MDGPGSGLIARLVLIGALTYVNAFFAKSEIAIVSANRNKIELLAEEGDRRAKTLLRITEDQTRFLSTIQVGITLAGFFSAGTAAKDISYYLGDVLQELGILYGQQISFIIIMIILSFITLVFGELVPKRIALQAPVDVALKSARFILIFYKFLSPFVSLLSNATKLVLKLRGQYSKDVEEKISEEEIKSYLKVGQQQGVINPSGEEMMVNIMDFDDKLAYEIMTPRTSIYMLDYDEFDTEKIEEMLQTGYSRVPIYRESPDNIVGTVYIKDLFIAYSKRDFDSIDIDEVIKEPYFIPETKNIDLLLKELQETKNYVAILIDEYGGFSGMVTIEDIVEEIVGEIEDEYDAEEKPIVKINNSTYIVDGAMELEDINDELDTELDSENHETMSGLMIELLGFIPEEGSNKNHSVIYGSNIRLTELGVNDKRISRIEIHFIEDQEDENGL